MCINYIQECEELLNVIDAIFIGYLKEVLNLFDSAVKCAAITLIIALCRNDGFDFTLVLNKDTIKVIRDYALVNEFDDLTPSIIEILLNYLQHIQANCCDYDFFRRHVYNEELMEYITKNEYNSENKNILQSLLSEFIKEVNANDNHEEDITDELPFSDFEIDYESDNIMFEEEAVEDTECFEEEEIFDENSL